jgi:hypothetical protein
VFESDVVFRSELFDGLDSVEEVRGRAKTIIERFNGAFALLYKAKPLRCDAVIWVMPDGKLHRAMPMEGGVYNITAKARDVSGEVQKWASLTEEDENYHLHEALVFFGRADNWFDVFKCYEAVRRWFASLKPRGEKEGRNKKLGEKRIAEFNLATLKEQEDFKESTTWGGRHYRGKIDKRPDNLLSFAAGYSLVRQVLRGALSKAEKRSSCK